MGVEPPIPGLVVLRDKHQLNPQCILYNEKKHLIQSDCLFLLLLIQGLSKQLQQYVFKIWNQQQNIPTDVDAFMDFLGEIERIHLKDEFRPTVVKCL